MGEILAAKITIGIVWKLFAPYTASMLEQGDVSEEKIRQLLLSEFSKIHESLNALRRKELVAAIAFMETGNINDILEILVQFYYNFISINFSFFITDFWKNGIQIQISKQKYGISLNYCKG